MLAMLAESGDVSIGAIRGRALVIKRNCRTGDQQ
jgi:hypothetical protein